MITSSENSVTVIPEWFHEELRRLCEGVGNIKDKVNEIAAIYVRAIDRDPSFREYIAEEVNGISPSWWRSLEMVGRNQLDGRVFVGVLHRNKLLSLPLNEQRKALDGSLSLLVRDGDSLQVKLDTITKDQADQLFARDHIRTLAEQRTWLESRSTIKRMRSDHTAPQVEIDKRHGCIIIGNVKIGASQLAEYLRKLTE